MTLRGLPCFEQYYHPRPVPCPPHPGFCLLPSRSYNIFQSRPRTSLPPDPCGTSRRTQDSPFGLFEPFGLRNAAQTFQCFMDQVLRGLPFCYGYLLIASANAKEHKEHLRQVFQRLSEYGILINPTKCVFGASSLEFLG